MSLPRSLRNPQCPGCRVRRLRAIECSGVELDLCQRCAGLWLEHDKLIRALQHYDPDLTAEVISLRIGENRGATRKWCPDGHGPLDAHMSADATLEVDCCPCCKGVWLDRGELAKLQTGKELDEARKLIGKERSLLTWLFQFVTQLPVEYNFPPRRPPMLTYSLIALNLAVFLGQFAGDRAELIHRFALHPDQAFSMSYWAGFLGHNFLHGNLVHLLGNMYFLWILGDNLEDLLGRSRFALFCLGAALTSGMAETLLATHPEIPVIGFSGVISAMLLAYAVLFRHAKLSFMLVIFQLKLPAYIWVAIWLGFNVAGYALNTGLISWLGHLGGAAFGLGFGLLTYRFFLRRDPLLRLLNGAALEHVS